MLVKTVDKNSPRISLNLRCGECIHFDKVAKFEKVCVKLGRTRKAKAPSCFQENVFVLQRQSPDVLNQIGLLYKDFTPSQSRVLLSILRNGTAFKRSGVAFGLPVYVCLGKDYLNNYYKGYVIGVTSVGTPTVYVTSDLGKKQVGKPAVLMLLPESVLTVTQFQKKRKELFKAKRLIDDSNPLFKTMVKKKSVTDSYEPPSLESAPASWFDAYSRTESSKKKFVQSKDGSLTYKV